MSGADTGHSHLFVGSGQARNERRSWLAVVLREVLRLTIDVTRPQR